MKAHTSTSHTSKLQASEFDSLTKKQRDEFDKMARRGGKSPIDYRNYARINAPAPGSTMQHAFHNAITA